MNVSVVIATHNRERLLDECLGHLARQAFISGDEVMVVDNNSTDGTSVVIDRWAEAFPVPLRHLTEPRPGKSRAVARAVAVAAGDILAFTDDDVNVDEAWIGELRRAMRADPDLALVGGPVAPRWERQPPRWLPEHGVRGRLAAPLALVDYGPTEGPLGDRTAVGANLAVRRDVFERVGGFVTHLGKLAGTLLGGEDHDLCDRVRAAGLRTGYVPTARVRHWVPANRLRLRYFVDWFYWSGITFAVLEGDRQPARSLAGVPLYVIRRFATGMARAAVWGATGRAARAVDGLTEAAFACGYALARWGLVARGATGRAALLGGTP